MNPIISLMVAVAVGDVVVIAFAIWMWRTSAIIVTNSRARNRFQVLFPADKDYAKWARLSRMSNVDWIWVAIVLIIAIAAIWIS